MTFDTTGITDIIKSKTIISTIAAALMYLLGTRGYIDYTTAVELATVLSALAVIFLRNALNKVENVVKEIPEAK